MTSNRASDIITRADELGIDPFTAYTILDDAIDHLDPELIDDYHNTDPAARTLLTYCMIHFAGDDDYDDLRHELRHEIGSIEEADLCDECRTCAYCCDC